MERCGNNEPCYICGKGMTRKKAANFLWIVAGGVMAASHDEPEPEDGGDMGMFRVGPDCIRRHKELIPFVIVRDDIAEPE